MNFPVLRPISIYFSAADGAAASPPNDATVVLTGLTLVFGILVILTLILLLSGKLFASLDKGKKQKKEEAKPKPAAPNPAAPMAAPPAQAAPAPAVQQGIPPEVVAAITAAVASIEGGKYTLRSVTTTPKGRGQWGLAGVISGTEPF